jgi:hypothetical protein
MYSLTPSPHAGVEVSPGELVSALEDASPQAVYLDAAAQEKGAARYVCVCSSGVRARPHHHHTATVKKSHQQQPLAALTTTHHQQQPT